ncbi:hypothetical protein OHB06_51760 [Streptomyces sp. NBC_01604]|uniref:hypothetical protein n=1 Tax=Streptomyces sp. NBC_01604 TaxID=2975894 RepID=UPI00386FF72C
MARARAGRLNSSSRNAIDTVNAGMGPEMSVRGQGADQTEAEAGQDTAADSARGRRSSWRRAWQEFLVAVTNPKALILFTVF